MRDLRCRGSEPTLAAMKTDSKHDSPRRFSLFSSRVQRNKWRLEKKVQLSLNQSESTNKGCSDPVPPKRIRISGHFSGRITTALHFMDVSMPVKHEVPCDAIESLLEAFLQAAKNHDADLEKMHHEEQANHIGHATHHHSGDHREHHGVTMAITPSVDHHHDQPPILRCHSGQKINHHGDSPGNSLHSRHARQEEDLAGAEVWSGLLGLLQAVQNAEIQAKQRNMTVASVLGATPTESKQTMDSTFELQKKADEEKPGLVHAAGEHEVGPAMGSEASAGEPEREHYIAFLARAEAGHCAKDKRIRELMLECDQLRRELDTWQTDQAISIVKHEFQEKPQQLSEKLVEIETLQGRVSQQEVDIEHLKSTNARLEGSLCLAESEAHKLMAILRTFGKSASADTNVFLHSCSSQASTCSSPQHSHMVAPVRTLAQRLEVIHPRGCAASRNSSAGIASPQPAKLNFTELARPSGPVSISKAAAAAAASIHDSRMPRFKSGFPGMPGAGKPPPMAVPSMRSRWQTSDVVSAWETRSVMRIQKSRATLGPNWPGSRIREFHSALLGTELALGEMRANLSC